MGDTMRKNLEILANVSIAVLCLTVSGVLVKKHFFPTTPPEPTPAVARGDVIDLPEGLAADAEVVVLAALSPGCGFCNESMTFYRQLSQSRAGHADLRIVAVVRPSDHVEEERRVLQAAGVEVDNIVTTDFKAMGIPGTPMLIATDRRGKVLDSWLGKLDESQEHEVLQALGLAETKVAELP